MVKNGITIRVQHTGGLRAEVWEDPICKLKAHSGGHGEDGEEKVREEARGGQEARGHCDWGQSDTDRSLEPGGERGMVGTGDRTGKL